MKHTVSLLLALAVLFSLTACRSEAPANSEDAVPGWTANQLVDAIQTACAEKFAGLETVYLYSGEEFISSMAPELYGIPAELFDDCATIRAGGANALELAVFHVTGDIDEVIELLQNYLVRREGDFFGYEPEQAALVSQGLATSYGQYAALLVCQDPAAVQEAFFAACQQDPTDSPQPSPTPSATPSLSVPADPTQPPDTTLTAESPAPASTEAPAEPPVSTPEPTPEPTLEPISYPGRIDYVQPNIDDMTIYDASDILAAWESGDPSALSEYDRAIYDKAVEVLGQTLTGSMSDYEKEAALYQWVTTHVDYDQTHYDNFAAMDPSSYTPYGGLIRGKAVCLGFATTFDLLMDMAGVECVVIIGAAYYSLEDHAWNMVRLNDQWYCADPTWDEGGSWNYFNVTSDYLARTNHQWNYNTIPEATTTDRGRS